jgi:formylglycine-generating enzyme required for sulfatase activity
VAALKNGDVFRDCAKTSDVCQDMVVIPAGSFVMGSPDGETPVVGLDGKPKSDPVAPAEKGRRGDEGPQHEVSIARFAVGNFDVTWEAWDRCVALGGCSMPSDQGFGRGKRPLINVSWDEAKVYIDWLSRLTGKSYRLLTEAEWEYTARAGTQTTYYFGDAAGEICRFANVADQSFKRDGGIGEIADCDDRFVFNSPTGSFPPNKFGLYDMAGNVFQWVQDCYVESYADAPSDGSAVRGKEGCPRVLRGGSWFFQPDYARAAGRVRGIPDYRGYGIGFRAARSLSPARTP